MNRDEEDKARELLARAAFWMLLDAAKKRTDIVQWRNAGGFEMEAVLLALDTGGQHPYLREWEARKAAAANRPAPGLRERGARRLAVLCRFALERAGAGKGQARRQIAKALERTGRRTGLPAASADTIERWERAESELTPEDKQVIDNALRCCGRDHEALTTHFLGLMMFRHSPLPTGAVPR